MDSWKERVYGSYMTNVFLNAHKGRRDLELQVRYFKKNYLRYMPKDKRCRILELGCGMGQFYYFCRKQGYNHYFGIDASKENIMHIKSCLDKRAKVKVMDMFEFLSKEDGSKKYDVVVLNDVIEHLTKPEIFAVLDGVKKILIRGGVFLIKTPNMANPYVSTAGRYIGIDHEIGFTEISMREVLTASGYKNITIVGTDVYVLNPLISVSAKMLAKLINLRLYFLSALYGRTTLHVFEKDILAVAHNE